MKKLVLRNLIPLFFILGFVLLSSNSIDRKIVKSDTKLCNVGLPPGPYFLCCVNGELLLYNILGQLVGWGDDCGGIPEHNCMNCTIVPNDYSNPITNPSDANEILDLLKSLKSASGDDYGGSLCQNCPVYRFKASELE
jgi:hypothetical protein